MCSSGWVEYYPPWKSTLEVLGWIGIRRAGSQNHLKSLKFFLLWIPDPVGPGYSMEEYIFKKLPGDSDVQPGLRITRLGDCLLPNHFIKHFLIIC